MVKKIKEAKVDLSAYPPTVECPHCRKKFYGWKLKEQIGKVTECEKCNEQMKLT